MSKCAFITLQYDIPTCMTVRGHQGQLLWFEMLKNDIICGVTCFSFQSKIGYSAKYRWCLGKSKVSGDVTESRSTELIQQMFLYSLLAVHCTERNWAGSQTNALLSIKTALIFNLIFLSTERCAPQSGLRDIWASCRLINCKSFDPRQEVK